MAVPSTTTLEVPAAGVATSILVVLIVPPSNVLSLEVLMFLALMTPADWLIVPALLFSIVVASMTLAESVTVLLTVRLPPTVTTSP